MLNSTKKVLATLTIVIPSFRRRKYLLRTMKYWSGKGPKIVVVDGDPNPISKEDLLMFEDNIVYINLPEGFSARLRAGASEIDTKYAIFNADDEFFLPSGLEACIKYLDQNPSYSSCIGRAIGFSFNGSQVLGVKAYPHMSDYQLSQENNADRLLHLMRDYSPHLWYSVISSDVWKSTIQTVTKKEFNISANQEVQFQMCVAFSGKSRVLPILTWLRSYENSPIKGTDPSLSSDNFFTAWHSSNYIFSIKSDLIDNVVAGLKKYSAINNKKLSVHVSQAFNEYSKFCLLGRPDKNNFKRVMQYLRHFLPLRFRKIIRGFLIKPKVEYDVQLINMAQIMSEEGVMYNSDELKKINSSVVYFNNHQSKINESTD